MTRRRLTGAALAGLLLALLAVPFASSAAFAHDSLVDADPGDGSTVTALTDITLTYSGAILGDEGANIVQVIGPDKLHYETACPALAGPEVTTAVALGEAGTYEVLWRVVSSDGHPVSGSYTFDYEPLAAPTAAVVGSESPLCGTAVPGKTAGDPGESVEGNPDPGLWVGLGIGAIVAVVVALGAWLVIRRPATKDGSEQDDQ